MTPKTPKVMVNKRDVTFEESTVDAKVQPMYDQDAGADNDEEVDGDREPSEFDGDEWVMFRAKLKEMKESDEAEKKRLAEEKVRIDAEIAERRKKMQDELAERLAAKMAKFKENQEKKKRNRRTNRLMWTVL